MMYRLIAIIFEIIYCPGKLVIVTDLLDRSNKKLKDNIMDSLASVVSGY